ncbi:MAG: acyl-CoA thioesterase domain-containing protein [Mycobacterium sp.]
MSQAPFVRGDADLFQPTEYARSGWSDNMINGPALVGLAAQTLEDEFGADGFLPARLTADLFRPAHRVPTAVRTRLVRDGHRLRASDCEILQDDVIVARATMIQYRTSSAPPGQEWISTGPGFAVPPVSEGAAYCVGSDAEGWSSSAGMGEGIEIHQNASRKRVYHRVPEVVGGRPASPFVRAVVAAEATSLVTNMGTLGIGYINGDLTVVLSRLPVGDYVGVQADSHWCAEGISVGAATLSDDLGPFGIGMVTALANPAAQIDFAGRKAGPTLEV